MSELYGTSYREETRPAAISATKLLGQVMFLVAIALAFAALGTWLGRDLAVGTARILSFAGFGMLLVSSFAGERFRVGSFAMFWLFATALVIGLGLGPVIAYFATVQTSRAHAGLRGHRGDRRGRGRARVLHVEGPRAVDAAAVAGRLRRVLRHGRRHADRGLHQPLDSAGIYLLSAALIVVDFNYIRKHGTEADAVWLATGIFVGGREHLRLAAEHLLPLMDTPLALDLATPEDLDARREAEKRGAPFLLLRDDGGAQRIVGLDERAGSVTSAGALEADVPLGWDPEVSRLHAELEFKAGEWTLCDDGFSQNGTYVNGLRIHGRRRLMDGDLVRIGQTLDRVLRPRR